MKSGESPTIITSCALRGPQAGYYGFYNAGRRMTYFLLPAFVTYEQSNNGFCRHIFHNKFSNWRTVAVATADKKHFNHILITFHIYLVSYYSFQQSFVQIRKRNPYRAVRSFKSRTIHYDEPFLLRQVIQKIDFCHGITDIFRKILPILLRHQPVNIDQRIIAGIPDTVVSGAVQRLQGASPHHSLINHPQLFR